MGSFDVLDVVACLYADGDLIFQSHDRPPSPVGTLMRHRFTAPHKQAALCLTQTECKCYWFFLVYLPMADR